MIEYAGCPEAVAFVPLSWRVRKESLSLAQQAIFYFYFGRVTADEQSFAPSDLELERESWEERVGKNGRNTAAAAGGKAEVSHSSDTVRWNVISDASLLIGSLTVSSNQPERFEIWPPSRYSSA